jgi:transposase
MDDNLRLCIIGFHMKRDGRSLAHKTLAELRRMAIQRVVEDEAKPSDIASEYGFCRNYLYPWLKKFQDGGWEALAGRIAEGRVPKLTERQRQQVKRWILGKDPRQYGFDFGLWSRRIVQALIEERMGVALGLTAVGRLLASMDITPQKPLRRAYERDPQAVKFWLEQRYPALKRRAQRLGAKIFFLDEAGFQSDPPLGRTYGLRGQTPVVVTSGQRQSLNVISAVNARGEFWAATYTGKLNAEAFVAFLKNFMKGRRGQVFLVVDGHPAHKANLVSDYVGSLGGRLELHPLPAYAPDLNPDEFVWSHMKNNGVSKKPLKKNESLKARIEEDLNQIKNNRALARSFFCAESVVYAKD